MAALKQDILGDSNHIFDQILADVIRATWLEMHYLTSVDVDATNRTASQSALLLRRLESAQRRLRSAIKQHYHIKKMLSAENQLPDLRIFRTQQNCA